MSNNSYSDNIKKKKIQKYEMVSHKQKFDSEDSEGSDASYESSI